MPLETNALTDVTKAKEYCGIDAADTSLDALIESLVNAASNAMENFCNRILKAQDIAGEEYDGTGSSNLFLKQLNINSILSVKINDVLVDASEYKLRKGSGIIVRLNSSWPKDVLNVKVSYNAGFTSVPADLELACKHLVKFYYKTDIADFSRTFGEGFVMRPEAWPGQVRALLSAYKRVLI
jgi:hypothetical protein